MVQEDYQYIAVMKNHGNFVIRTYATLRDRQEAISLEKKLGGKTLFTAVGIIEDLDSANEYLEKARLSGHFSSKRFRKQVSIQLEEAVD